MSGYSLYFSSFNSGEIAPELHSRKEFGPLRSGWNKGENIIPLVEGPAVKRGGTKFIHPVKDHDKKVRLIDFEYSTVQTYILEFGDKYVRFINSGEIVHRYEDGVDTGEILEIETPYCEDELSDIQYAQSADVLFLAHPDHPPHMLSRAKEKQDLNEKDTWELKEIEFKDGPYLDENLDDEAFLRVSGYTDTITVTAEGKLDDEPHEPFTEEFVGQPIRFKIGNKWGWMRVTKFVSATEVEAEVKSDFGSVGRSEIFRFAAWSKTNGYPRCVTLFEQSWIYGGTYKQQQTWWRTVGGSYEEMQPTEPDGTVKDDLSITRTLGAGQVNVIQWLAPAQYLTIGTIGAEWRVTTGSDEPLTPDNGSLKLDSSCGSNRIQPVRVGAALLFVQRQGRKVFSLSYSFESNGLKNKDLTQLASHITDSGIISMAFQREPQGILWCVLANGQLLGMSYNEQQKVLAWHRHELGGSYQAGRAVVESVAVVPSDGRDEVWLVVKRTINEQTRRYIERLEPAFQTGQTQADAFYLDCGMSYAGEKTTTVSGLDHLEGEKIGLLVDGAVHPKQIVENGQVQLRFGGKKIHAGLNYDAWFFTLSIEGGSPDGTSTDRQKRIVRVNLDMHNTLGLKIGPSLDKMDTLPFRSTSGRMDAPPELYTGKRDISFAGPWTHSPAIVVMQNQPLPMMIRAITPRLQVSAR
ncbi:MAG: hypothetical protein ACNI27_03760 [Desulfovibrio sp.]